MSGSGSGNSWFGMAPRSSTPTPGRSHSNASAPNSPLGLPRVGRAPSKDALERSIHNDSGHGKSTLQIIKELKASNAKFSAKTADMEAEFMNQLNEMTTNFNEKEDELKKALAAKEQQFTTLESRVASTETRIRERDTQLATLKEETTFQRHTIADLKNQLYQLQHEIEDAEYDKRDEVDKWALEKKEMERQIESLKEEAQSQASEGQQVMQSWKQLEVTKGELESTKKRLHETQSSLANMEQENKRAVKEHATIEADFRGKIETLEKDGSAASDLTKVLAEKDQTISTLREEIVTIKSQVTEATTEIAELKVHCESEEKYRLEETDDLRVLNESLQEDIERLKVELEDTDKDLDEREEILHTKNEQIADLQSELESVSTELTEFKKQTAASSEEQVGLLVKQLDVSKEEAEQLRVELKSSAQKHSEQMDQLTKQFEASGEEAEQLRLELKSASQKYSEQTDQLSKQFEASKEETDEVRNELESTSKKHTELITQLVEQLDVSKAEAEELRTEAESGSQKNTGLIRQLVEQLDTSKEEIEELQIELETTSQKYSKQVDTLREEVQTLIADRDDIEIKLESAEETRDKALSDLKRGHDQRNQDGTRSEQRLREIVASSAKERAELETEFEARLANVEQSYQKKIAQISESNDKSEELAALKEESMQKMLEIERLSSQMEEVEALASSSKASEKEIQSLREKVRVLEAKKASADRAKKQLREAQIALVALDDEKTMSDQKHLDMIAALESEKIELERESRSRVLQKDAELTQLRERSSASPVSDYVAEIENLKAELRDRELEIPMTRSSPSVYSAHVDEFAGGTLRKELATAKRSEERLQASLYAARQEQADQQNKFREKLEDRDTTISALVKSSVSQEQKVASMKEEVAILKRKMERSASNSSAHEMEAVRRARDAEFVDEIENLRSSLEDSKDTEKRWLHDVSTMERKLAELEAENKRLKIKIGSNRSPRVTSPYSDHQEKLQERDSAIATLVKQSMSLEEQVTSLRAENMSLRVEKEGLTSGIKNHAGPSWGEVRRLQKESEIFAGQIIEQDEELEVLRAAVEERDTRVASLERDMLGLKRKASSHNRSEDRVEDLQAELDEMQEANKTQRIELRDLRKQLRETKTNANEIMDVRAELEQAHYAMNELKSKAGSTARDDASTRRQLDEAQKEKEEIEAKLNQQIESMRRQRNHAVEEMEGKLKERDATIEELKRDDKVIMLEGEIKQLSKKLFEKAEMLEDSQISNSELKKMLNDQSKDDELAKLEEEKEKISQQLHEMQQQLDEFEADRKKIDDIKQQLHRANAEKEDLEDRIVDSYERKMSLMKLDKDVTIDGLRKELIESKAVSSEYNEDVVKHIESLEIENSDARDELEAKLQLKNTKIHALEQTLGAQEQLVENMRAEMDQLQSSMERTSLSRRAEIEEMQQEMIDTSSKAQRQEREITSLKMSLEDSRLEYKTEVAKLREQIELLEEAPRAPEPAAQKKVDVRLDDVKERLENLKWRNTSLQEENLKLRTRLEKVEGEVFTTRSDQDKASAMEEEVVLLRKRVQQMQEKPSLPAQKNSIPRNAAPPRNAAQKPPNDRGGSRFKSSRASSPSRNKNKIQGEAPRRAQASPLRFLKRRSQKDTDGKSSVDDNSSSASKMTF